MKAGGDVPAPERVRQRIAEWLKARGHGAQRKLAAAVPAKYGEHRSDQWISDIVNRRADITLQDLDAVADHMGIPPGDLVRKPDRNYHELTMAETTMLQFFRWLPWDARQHWLGWLHYVFPTQVRAKIALASTIASGVKPVRPVQGGGRAHDSGSANTGNAAVSREVLTAQREDLLQQQDAILNAINELTTRIESASAAPSPVDTARSRSTRHAAGDHAHARALARHRARKK